MDEKHRTNNYLTDKIARVGFRRRRFYRINISIFNYKNDLRNTKF